MKRSLLALMAIILGFSFPAFSTTLTYELHGGIKGEDFDREFFTGFCGLPETFSMDSKQDIGKVIIEKTRYNSGYGKTTVQRIELSSGSANGGDLAPPFSGDYRTHVFIVKLDIGSDSSYPFGVYSVVDITTWGPTSAPNAFEVQFENLNYKSSAELAEDYFCRQYSYILKK